MIFEDAHWTDPTSLEALGRAVDRIRAVGVLLIVTYRPEFEPPWIGQPYVSARTIRPLTRREIDTMIDLVIGNKPLPTGIRHDIIERADGIPLFVEEMTKAVLEAGSERVAELTTAAVRIHRYQSPQACTRRSWRGLTGLSSAKEVAQIGAAMGVSFRMRFWQRSLGSRG